MLKTFSHVKGSLSYSIPTNAGLPSNATYNNVLNYDQQSKSNHAVYQNQVEISSKAITSQARIGSPDPKDLLKRIEDRLGQSSRYTSYSISSWSKVGNDPVKMVAPLTAREVTGVKSTSLYIDTGSNYITSTGYWSPQHRQSPVRDIAFLEDSKAIAIQRKSSLRQQEDIFKKPIGNVLNSTIVQKPSQQVLIKENLNNYSSLDVTRQKYEENSAKIDQILKKSQKTLYGAAAAVPVKQPLIAPKISSAYEKTVLTKNCKPVNEILVNQQVTSLKPVDLQKPIVKAELQHSNYNLPSQDPKFEVKDSIQRINEILNRSGHVQHNINASTKSQGTKNEKEFKMDEYIYQTPQRPSKLNDLEDLKTNKISPPKILTSSPTHKSEFVKEAYSVSQTKNSERLISGESPIHTKSLIIDTSLSSVVRAPSENSNYMTENLQSLEFIKTPQSQANPFFVTKKQFLDQASLTMKIEPKKYVEEFYPDGTYYKGDKVGNLKQGNGEISYADGAKYQGGWKYDKRDGYGQIILTNGDIEYDGEWSNDVYHGSGTLINRNFKEESCFDYKDFDSLKNNWRRYEGEFSRGKRHGLGTLILGNSEKFVGQFVDNKLEGTGTLNKSDGTILIGDWRNNKFIEAI